MDENRPTYSLNALGSSSSGAALRLPGAGFFPGVDDHLVQPEVTRDEIIGGHRVVALPAQLPHATRHGDLYYVLHAHVAAGYQAALDLLTRHDEDSDFATDACVLKIGTDPATGSRHLEELAFEVVSTQNQKLVTEKALRMHRRGVRRIFGVWVKGRRVREWSPEDGGWRTLPPGAVIEDPCLAAPLRVAALLDAGAAEEAVVAALAAKRNPAMRAREAKAESRGEARGKAKGEAKGKAEGMAESILGVLEARGLAISGAQRQEILACQDLERLDRWLRRAAVATAADELMAEP